MNSLVAWESIKVAIDNNARDYAARFAAEQASVAKGKQVYLNTLAVCALHRYLTWLSIDSSLARSDCWQPNLRSIFNLADLILPNLGCLECRIVIEENNQVEIARSLKDDCLGYVVVSFDRDLREVNLLGFLKTSQVREEVVKIELDRLHSLDVLLETIERHRTVNNLKQWWVDIFQAEWQQTDILLSSNGSYFRSLQEREIGEEKQLRHVSRGKTIDFNDGSLKIVLVTTISEISIGNFDVCLRVYPSREDRDLPMRLRLELWDENDRLCMEAEARDRDSCLELKFNCDSNEEFSIKMILNNTNAIERFII
jgi:hypothetical protein